MKPHMFKFVCSAAIVSSSGYGVRGIFSRNWQILNTLYQEWKWVYVTVHVTIGCVWT